MDKDLSTAAHDGDNFQHIARFQLRLVMQAPGAYLAVQFNRQGAGETEMLQQHLDARVISDVVLLAIYGYLHSNLTIHYGQRKLYMAWRLRSSYQEGNRQAPDV